MKIVLILLLAINLTHSVDYYDLLDIPKDANNKDIRKAFKKKALKHHPDKNKDDPDAQDNFIKINRAYEVLKDENLRRKYDQYGEEGLDDSKSRGRKYQTWNFYHDNFGIYDDDPEIITLTNSDFEQTVLGSNDIWFINFYHPSCSHCHTLAPTWRKLSIELNHVVRIGAVNCDDEHSLCRSQGVYGYPKLMVYPEGEIYEGSRNFDELLNFVAKKLRPNPFIHLTGSSWQTSLDDCDQQLWVVSLSHTEVEEFWKAKLGAFFENLVCLAEVDCNVDEEICELLKLKGKTKFFRTKFDVINGRGLSLSNSDPQELYKEVLKLLPNIASLSSSALQDSIEALETGTSTTPLLVVFSGDADDDQLELRKLSAFLPSFKLGQVWCSQEKIECDRFYISKTPVFALFKEGGVYEMYRGRILARDIAVFAKDAALSPDIGVITPDDFQKVVNGGGLWIIDFFSPWCPPCKKLVPEFRKASRWVDLDIQFGTVDCTAHGQLCRQRNVRQYPTIVVYGTSTPHTLYGFRDAEGLVDFIQDSVDPKVIDLDAESFYTKVSSKPSSELWVVDFYANWCGPCQEMGPEYAKFARLASDLPNVFVARIDCAQFPTVCNRNGIRSYPSIAIFPFEFEGTRRKILFSGWSRDANSFRVWLNQYLPSNVKSLDDESFEAMLRSDRPFLVDFHAPWCGPCHRFAPVFSAIADELVREVQSAKVDCQAYNWICRSASIGAYPSVKLYLGVREGEVRQSMGGYEIENLNKAAILETVRFFLKKPSKRISDEL